MPCRISVAAQIFGHKKLSLQDQANAHQILERLRVENEEKRVAEANERAFALEQELNILKSKMTNPSGPDSSRRRKELQDSVRENIKLQEELQRCVMPHLTVCLVFKNAFCSSIAKRPVKPFKNSSLQNIAKIFG